jgi:hypothetical protein
MVMCSLVLADLIRDQQCIGPLALARSVMKPTINAAGEWFMVPAHWVDDHPILTRANAALNSRIETVKKALEDEK